MNRYLAALIVALTPAPSYAAGLPPSTVPGSPPGFDYPMSLDSVAADPKNHHVLYQDRHIRLIEVTLWPHDTENRHGHAYASVFAADDALPKMSDASTGGPPPFGAGYTTPGAAAFPVCSTLGPQTPHAATIQDSFPQHFYRMEFKRLDPAGFATRWRTTLPALARTAIAQAATPPSGPAFTPAWPFPIGYETVRAAPATYHLLVETGHVRVTEVTIPPGATTPMVGTPYYAVQAYDTPQPGTPGGPTVTARELDGSRPLRGSETLGGAHAPPNLDGPTCTITAPVPPRQITNTGTIPVHFYQIEFLRIDGADFATKWKEWYPAMAEGPKPPAQ